MLYVCHGSNYESIQEKIRSIGDTTHIERFDARGLSYDTLDGYIGGSLFGDKSVVVLDGCYTDYYVGRGITDRLEAMQQSSNMFILTERSLNKEELQPLEKAGGEITKHTLGQENDRRTFNTFILADNYLDRDVKQLWVNYHKALRTGSAPEQLHGLLWWQIVNAIVITEEGANPGLKEFPYKKIKNKSSDLSLSQLYHDARELVDVLHKARNGEGELERLLEEWIVTMT